MNDYIIEASKDGKKWHFQTSFNNGDLSRWEIPFDLETAKREAIGFRHARYKDWKYTRLVVNI